MGEVASSIALQAVVGAIARTGDADFNLHRTLTALAEIAQGYAGAGGVAIEELRDGGAVPLLVVGLTGGNPRRLPIVAEGNEIGCLAIYGAPMFGPATADRTQVVADLAALAFMRAAHLRERNQPALDDERFRLISGVGLNLRNTLGAASGYMQLVEMEADLDAKQHEYAERARRAIMAAVALISDLLELTRADAGKLTFEQDAVNAQAVAQEAARKHEANALAKGCDINVVTKGRTPLLRTDSTHMQQIVNVLVYNAVRYSPPNAPITIEIETRHGRRAEDPGMWLCVSVSDKGEGVLEAERVFEELHRVEQSKGNVRFKLAICRRIARLLGGDLTLETAPAMGATFTLWLPAQLAV